MNNFYKVLISFLFIILSIYSFGQNEIKKALIGKWNLTNTSFNDGTYEPSDSTTFFLEVKENGLFSFNFGENPAEITEGSWELVDRKMTLYPLGNEFSIKIDSSFITLDSTNREIQYYADGVHFMSNKNGKLRQKVALLSFNISKLNKGHLQLESKGTVSHFIQKYYKHEPAPPESKFSLNSIFRAIVGMLFLVFVAWLFSSNRKAINWALVIKGLSFQIVIAILVLKVSWVEAGFESISRGFVNLIGYTNVGVDFLFGQFGIGKIQGPLMNFAFKILPTIVFFSSLMSLLYYWGILQRIVFIFAWVMKRVMNLSGAESLAAAGNVFLGQTESPLLVNLIWVK